MPRKEIKQWKIGQTLRKSFLIVKPIKMWNKYPLRERMEAHLWGCKNRARPTLRKKNRGQNSLLAGKWAGWRNGCFPSLLLKLLWCFHLSRNLVPKADIWMWVLDSGFNENLSRESQRWRPPLIDRSGCLTSAFYSDHFKLNHHSALWKLWKLLYLQFPDSSFSDSHFLPGFMVSCPTNMQFRIQQKP